MFIHHYQELGSDGHNAPKGSKSHRLDSSEHQATLGTAPGVLALYC